MEIREQLLRLVRIQELALESRGALQVVETAPARIEEIEGRFRERNAEYMAVKQRHQALEEDQRTRSGELQLLEEQRKKYKSDLMLVQNQREYAAMLKEIDAVEMRISEHEVAILRDMEEIESTRTDLEAQSAHIQEEREVVAKERAQVTDAADLARTRIEEITVARRALESELPKILVASVSRLEAGRQGVFLSRAEEGVCRSCFVRVRPQVFQEIKLASKIHACGSCRRLLYHEPTLTTSATPPGDRSAANASGGGHVKAANGKAL